MIIVKEYFMEALALFMSVVEKEEFVEGHEVLEEQWREWKNDADKREESFILKGLINGSTALALYRLGRKEGGARVWETFEKYRPLIHTLGSCHTPLYQKAADLLDKKYKEIV